MTRSDAKTDTALEMLWEFRQSVLPGVLRRIALWKGFPPRQLQDWQEDVLQELCLDALTHANEVAALDRRARHQRWMRLVQRLVYNLARWQRRQQPFVGEPTARDRADGWHDHSLTGFATLQNGRINLAATARAAQTARRSLREQLDRLAGQLGWNKECERFWRKRTVEALTGLAADLLRLDPRLCLLDATSRPTPERRMQRLRRLARRIPVHPATRPARSALRVWQRGRDPAMVPPRRLLEQATALLPEWPPAWAWLFEACCLEQDLTSAARAVRSLHRLGAAPRRTVALARARLLELRGRREAALALLRRAARRARGDARLGKLVTDLTDQT